MPEPAPAEPAADADVPAPLWHVVPALVYLVLVFVVGGADWSSVGGQLPKLRHFDKLMHALVFAGFVPVLSWGLQGVAWPRRRGLRWLVAVVLSSAAGGLLELYQTALPHRSAEWLDLVADVGGATFVGLLYLWRASRAGAAHLLIVAS